MALLDLRSLKSLPTLGRHVYWTVLVKFPTMGDFEEFIATDVEVGVLKFPANEVSVFGQKFSFYGPREFGELRISFLDTDMLKFKKLFQQYYDYLYDEFGRCKFLTEVVIDVIVKVYSSKKELVEENRWKVILNDAAVNWKGVSKPELIEKEVSFVIVGK